MLRVINLLLFFILTMIGLDLLLTLFDANQGNVIVGAIAAIAAWLLTPFRNVFNNQNALVTAAIGALAYFLIALGLSTLARRPRYSRDGYSRDDRYSREPR